MTVKELIGKLLQYKGDMEVRYQGEDEYLGISIFDTTYYYFSENQEEPFILIH